jgi:glutamine amidotransferase
MCRMLGIVSREPRHHRRCLGDAPRSLAALSREHGDGWGIAVHAPGCGWSFEKGAANAANDPAYDTAMSEARGTLLVSHVRKRTVGEISLLNTHPFRHGEWVFAHNGTIDRIDELRRGAGEGAVVAIRGDTDSELLFAYLMAGMAALAGAQLCRSRFVTDMALARTVCDLARIPGLGAATFLLSDGTTLYAYRQGRPLFLLQRQAGRAAVGAPEDRHTEAILVASEPVTDDERWSAISEGTLVAIWRAPRVGWSVLVGP